MKWLRNVSEMLVDESMSLSKKHSLLIVHRSFAILQRICTCSRSSPTDIAHLYSKERGLLPHMPRSVGMPSALMFCSSLHSGSLTLSSKVCEDAELHLRSCASLCHLILERYICVYCIHSLYCSCPLYTAQHDSDLHPEISSSLPRLVGLFTIQHL